MIVFIYMCRMIPLGRRLYRLCKVSVVTILLSSIVYI